MYEEYWERSDLSKNSKKRREGGVDGEEKKIYIY